MKFAQPKSDKLNFFALEQNPNQNKQQNLKKAKQIPKYKTIFAFQNSIKFLNIPKLRKKQECIVLAEQLLSSAQKKFGGESSIWSTIAIYNSSFSKNNIRLSDALRNVKQNLPNILERWMVFAMMHDMEDKQSKGSGSNQLGVTFRIRFSKATKEHELSKAFLSQAYMSLSRENMDLEQIMSLIDKAILHERDSREIYEELMKLHPNSISILRGFGALLRDIYRDDETALLMFNQATSIEEDNAMITVDNAGDGQSQMQKSIHSQHPGSIASKSGKSINSTSNQKKKKKKKSSNKSSLAIDLSEDKSNLIPGFLQLILLFRKRLLQLMTVLKLWYNAMIIFYSANGILSLEPEFYAANGILFVTGAIRGVNEGDQGICYYGAFERTTNGFFFDLYSGTSSSSRIAQRLRALLYVR
ncbi:MAG: hypothetical protein EZS28_040475, partial [Streblomastix strix]